MTEQHRPDYNHEVARLHTASITAQARIADLEKLLNLYRTELASAQFVIAALTTERDMLMSRLGESHQTIAAREEGTL
jgi:hypothetical protein